MRRYSNTTIMPRSSNSNSLRRQRQAQHQHYEYTRANLPTLIQKRISVMSLCSAWFFLILVGHVIFSTKVLLKSSISSNNLLRRDDSNCTTSKRPRSRGLEHIQVAATDLAAVKLLCFVMTDSSNHAQVNSILSTWGGKCRRFVIFTNAENPTIYSEIQSDQAQVDLVINDNATLSTYPYLWQKLHASIRYLCERYSQQYDWFLKVDTDTFVVIENLVEFLSKKEHNQTPNVFGRLISYPILLEDLVQDPSEDNVLSTISKNGAEIRELIIQRISMISKDRSYPLYYLQGGAYVMNNAMLRLLGEQRYGDNGIWGVGTPPEDLAFGLNLWLKGIALAPSRDDQNRELFHPELPGDMIDVPDRANWMVDYHKHVKGGLKRGIHCCSRYSISFHHVPKTLMSYYFNQLYINENC